MYQEFFSLSQPPFLITPSPDFIFFTEQHKEALAHLTYGLQGNGGFVVLTGEVGTGKTIICQFLLQDMPTDTDIASITNTAVSEISLLVDICDQFSIIYDRENISLKVMFDALTSWMLKNHQHGRHAIVLIDEAQYLSFDVLEQLRLLTNIETDNQKPLQIILVGQTELQKKLLTTELRQLSQRITARYHLRALNKQETNFYIHHRLNLSGARGLIFDPQSIIIIHKASRGIPRLINQICDRCLLSAYTQSSTIVSPKITKKAIKEAELPKQETSFSLYFPHAVVITSVTLLALFINSQTPKIKGYFEQPKEEVMQQEWLRVINTATAQQSNKIANTHKTQKNETEKIEIKTQPTTELVFTPSVKLLAMPSTSYSLQLAALPNEKSVHTFFIEHTRLKENTYLYQGIKNGHKKFVILLGTFNNYKMAKLASKELKKQFPTIDPWIKDFKTIHNDLK